MHCFANRRKYEFMFSMNTLLPVHLSHLFPKHPLVQAHVPSSSLQLPPFWQGLGSQIFADTPYKIKYIYIYIFMIYSIIIDV